MHRRYLLLLIGFPLVALPAAFASCEGRLIERAERALAAGPHGEAVVVDKRSHSGTSWNGRSSGTTYTVTLEAPGGRVTRRVRREEFAAAAAGDRTPWYVDPATGRGLAGIGGEYPTHPGGYGVLVGLAFLWRRGEQRHAVDRGSERKGNVHFYEAAFEVGGRVYTLRHRMPIEGEALRACGNRIVVLVDPLLPRRATVVPRL